MYKVATEKTNNPNLQWSCQDQGIFTILRLLDFNLL